jgi:hypothetical protein
MSSAPVICFGQQPCGFFPRRYLFAKLQTARRMQAQMGGKIVFFYHDSDHDPRETRTLLRHRKNGESAEFNFIFDNKLQRKYSPMFLKRIVPAWHAKTTLQLPAFVAKPWVKAFAENTAPTVADFCLEMYRRMGLLGGVEVQRSGDPAFRTAACDIPEFFVDVPHGGEIVRARFQEGGLSLHEGGDAYINLPLTPFTKAQISPTRDTRLRWMQSVVHCTHYIRGGGEKVYLKQQDAPEITFVDRDPIDRPDEAYTDEPAA